MNYKEIDGNIFRKMYISGANELIKNKDLINSLNVFPVPDGDTGSNMSMTIIAAVQELNNSKTDDCYEIAKLVSKGALKGARGNSGVILSQLFRGFAVGLKDKKVIESSDIALAIIDSAKAAYKAVMKPKEGTILTVARTMAESVEEKRNEYDNVNSLLADTITVGNKALAETTEMLPELKEANVIDSGGKGLMCFYEGMLYALDNILEDFVLLENNDMSENTSMGKNIDNVDIKFKYCTEFIIKTSEDKSMKNEMEQYLSTIGDSIVAVEDDGLMKIHFHTNQPNKGLEKALMIGDLTKIKIENMQEQHSSLIEATHKKYKEKKDKGFIAIANGDGIADIFTEYGVDYIIKGGQTMNPSTDDILKAIDNVNSDNIIILPNNKNIILAANQAKELSDKNVEVVESVNIPQGLAAMLSCLDGASFEETITGMKDSLDTVQSASITYAVRDTTVNGKEIKQNDIISMLEGKIISADKDVDTALKNLITSTMESNPDFISLYYGEDVSEEDAKAIEKYLKDNLDIDFEIRYGGQPLYYYIISVE